MSKSTRVSGLLHRAAAREVSLYRRLHVIIIALAAGGILSLIGTGICLQIKEYGVNTVWTPSFFLPVGGMIIVSLLFFYLRFLLKHPWFTLSDDAIVRAYHFPISLFVRPVLLAKADISKGMVHYRPLQPEIILGNEEGAVLWIPLWLSEIPACLEFCDTLSLGATFSKDISRLRAAFLPSSKWRHATLERRDAFLKEFGFARLYIIQRKKSGTLSSTPPLELYDAMRLAVDTVQLIFLIQRLWRKIPWSGKVSMDAMRSYLLLSHHREVEECYRDLALKHEDEAMRILADSWLAASKHKRYKPLPLSGFSNRLFSAGGHYVTVTPSGEIKTAEGDISLERFPVVRAVSGFWGIQEIQLIDAMGQKMFFNRDAPAHLRRILLYAPHMGEVTVTHFSGFFFLGILKKFCSRLDSQDEKE
ncbi:hypothetical protein KKF84_01465 [Myxococcota bacterium]|nr:hypothetical protein [Myxococcota bacterium]